MDPLVLVGLPLLPVALVLWMRRRHAGVPRGWQLSQSEAAILHRRVHRCVDETRRAVARSRTGVPVEELKSLTDELYDQAVAIDHKLVEASKLPQGKRHKPLIELKYRIIDAEQMAARVRALAVDTAQPRVADTDEGLARLRDRLDTLDAARREAYGIGRPPTIRDREPHDS
ncbi:MAG TPA: hypothetical protein VFA62_08285 [Acidimicrobiia bacterium]|nr:hypothetical protein [Acidimicrobiia bacterium]